MTWKSMVALDPRLGILEAEMLSRRVSMTDVMLARRLNPLVGEFADHPRLRNGGAYQAAYGHLASLRAEPAGTV